MNLLARIWLPAAVFAVFLLALFNRQELVDRFLENLTGHERPHPPIRAVVRVGEALRVDSRRLQGPRDDSLLTGIEEQVQTMLDALSTESAMYESASGGR